MVRHRDLAHHRGLGRVSLLVPVRRCVQSQEGVREASRVRGLPRDKVDRHPQAAAPSLQADLVATPWSSSANPSAAMAAPPEAELAPVAPDRVHPRVLVLHPGQACPVGCASQWPLESSCNSRSRWGVPPRRHQDALSLEANLVPERKPLLRSHGQQHRQPPVVPMERAPVLRVSAVPAAPIGTTAPSSKPCAAVRPRSSARKFTSLGRTTTR